MVEEITRNAPLPTSRQESARQVQALQDDVDLRSQEQVRRQDRVSISNEAREALADDNRRTEARVESVRHDEQRAEESSRRSAEATSRRRAEETEIAEERTEMRETEETEETADVEREYNDRTRA